MFRAQALVCLDVAKSMLLPCGNQAKKVSMIALEHASAGVAIQWNWNIFVCRVGNPLCRAGAWYRTGGVMMHLPFMVYPLHGVGCV